MGILDKIKGPIFIKDDSEAELQLEKLVELRREMTGENAKKIDDEIRKVEAGIFGEKTVRYELANCNIPMYILHDLHLEVDELTAQIDYLIITRKHTIIIECKNLYGDIEINSAGDFIRTMTFGQKIKKEGIYSPITQNKRHLERIKQIRMNEKSNMFTKVMFEKYFYSNYRSIVVLANPKTILYDRYAKKEVKDQVIKVDQLVEYIKKLDFDSKVEKMNEKRMEELANFFLNCHKPRNIDYTAKFKTLDELEIPNNNIKSKAFIKENFKEDFKEDIKVGIKEVVEKNVKDNLESTDKSVICDKCGSQMVKRKATKGVNEGKEFYGCTKYPKCRGIVNIKNEEV